MAKLKEARLKDAQATVRVFKPPNVNFQAADYTELVDWNKVEVTFPPVLRFFSDNDLDLAVDSKTFIPKNVPPYPCHTQAVERTVQLVSKASQNGCGQSRRDGFIRNTLESRQQLPKFMTKSDYNCSP